jgi:hypothetical protein
LREAHLQTDFNHFRLVEWKPLAVSAVQMIALQKGLLDRQDLQSSPIAAIVAKSSSTLYRHPCHLFVPFLLIKRRKDDSLDVIRQYNCPFAFTSFRASEVDAVVNSRCPWTWKADYQIYHSAGRLLPAAGEQPSYAQLYFYDVDDAVNYRKTRNPNLRQELMALAPSFKSGGMSSSTCCMFHRRRF